MRFLQRGFCVGLPHPSAEVLSLILSLLTHCS